MPLQRGKKRAKDRYTASVLAPESANEHIPDNHKLAWLTKDGCCEAEVQKSKAAAVYRGLAHDVTITKNGCG